ncbi:hypothetical protein BDE40_1774 [Litoreibacter halocynthiae]|uniref:Lipoprotein n=1 Tax=Litoreibacter halocynthiae TaxID=1242689 RepID=A0A4R7LIE1_9RHOB|nr:hypothetical protein [Litoreibacter halocynthiae]TDT75049.1 hypothetical protein BDE40_1774 [Litoreibacter halocynthiae]
MRRIATAALALALAACAMPEQEVVIVEPVLAEPAVAEAGAPNSKLEACVPGEDDGIGGTGCAVD